MIGKAERGPAAVETIARHGAAYLVAVGGAALPGGAGDPRRARRRWPDLGMEAIHELKVRMPVMVAVDARGNSDPQSRSGAWRGRHKTVVS